MKTAFSVQPKLHSLPKPERTAPMYASLDDAIAAMKIDARAIRARTASHAVRDLPTEQVEDEEILAYIAAHPGCTAQDIAAAVGRHETNMRPRMSSMEHRGQVRVELFTHPKSHRNTRKFFSVPNPPQSKNGRPKAKKPGLACGKVIAFIRKNPGCTSIDIAAEMGCTAKAAAARISDARKFVDIRSERQGGNSTPRRHWVLE